MTNDGTISIGEAAEQLGMTTRTLRYYEEIGLVSSNRPSAGAQRRYGPAEIERLRHIRELQTLLGLDLDEIGEQLAASDRLDGLKAEFRSGPPAERREAILEECGRLLERLHAKVLERQQALETFLEELDARIARVEAARKSTPRSAGAHRR